MVDRHQMTGRSAETAMLHRAVLPKAEIAVGSVLVVLCVAHFGWCMWSLPRFGEMSAHGLETVTCNRETRAFGIVLGVIRSFRL